MIDHCSWDTTVLLITISAVVIILASIVFLALKIKYYRKEGRNWTAFFCLLGMILACNVIVYMSLDCPLQVVVSKEALTIRLVKGERVIPLDDIEEIRRYDADSQRVSGSGGAFGFLGKFTNVELGYHQMYVTDSSHKILVKTSDKTLIFSCDKPDELIRYVVQSQ